MLIFIRKTINTYKYTPIRKVVAMAQEHLTVEGIIRDVSFEERKESNYNHYYDSYRLYVLLLSETGQFFSTYIEKDSTGQLDSDKEPPIQHLEKLANTLEKYVGYRVKVTVARDTKSKDDMPLYRVIKQYQIIGEIKNAQEE